MKAIIIENTIYKVSDKECNKLIEKANEIRDADYPKNQQLEMELSDYLEDNVHKYKLVGDVYFDFRL